jgi:hypothetical protein
MFLTPWFLLNFFHQPSFQPAPPCLARKRSCLSRHMVWGSMHHPLCTDTAPLFVLRADSRAHPYLYQCVCVCTYLCLYLELVYAYNIEYMFFSAYLNHVSRLGGTERRPCLSATSRLRPPSRSHGRFCPEDVRWDGRRVVLSFRWGPSVFCRRSVMSAPLHIFRPHCGMA